MADQNRISCYGFWFGRYVHTLFRLWNNQSFIHLLEPPAFHLLTITFDMKIEFGPTMDANCAEWARHSIDSVCVCVQSEIKWDKLKLLQNIFSPFQTKRTEWIEHSFASRIMWRTINVNHTELSHGHKADYWKLCVFACALARANSRTKVSLEWCEHLLKITIIFFSFCCWCFANPNHSLCLNGRCNQLMA